MELVTITSLIITVLATFAQFDSTNAQIFSMGYCNASMPTMENFNHTKYAGKWYEIKRSFNTIEDKTKCLTVHFSLRPDNAFNMKHTFKSTDMSRSLKSVSHTANVGVSETGKLRVYSGVIAAEQPLWILETDYDNYAVTYACFNVFPGKHEYAWILSRTAKLDDKLIKSAEAALKLRNVQMEMITAQQDCEDIFIDS